MARDQKLNVTISAADKASETIREVDKKAQQLEGEHKLDITADDNASDELAGVDKKAKDLDGRKVAVQVETNDSASRGLDRVDSKRRDLDGADARVTVNADDNATRVLDRVEAKLRELDGRRAGLGVGGAAAAGAAGGAAVGAGLPVVGDIAQSATNAANLALDVQSIATLTGASLEEAAKFAGVWRDAGFEIGDAVDLLIQVNGALAENPDMREKLKIGGATDLLEQFLLAVKGIQTEYDTAGSRAQAASRLFGEEGVKQVLRVQNAVGDFGDAVARREPIVDPEDVERSRKINEQLTEAKAKWDQVQLKVLEALNLVLGKEFDDTIVDFLFGPDDPRSNFRRERQTIERNTGGFFGGAFGPITAPDGGALFNQVLGSIAAPIVAVINNPPGTQAQVVQSSEVYRRRNDVRYS